MNWKRAFPAILSVVLGAALPSVSLAADVISANERCSPKTGCSFSAPQYSILGGESPIFSMPPVLDFPHDVVSVDKGLDGRPLFEASPVGAGQSTIVEGAEYLSPGVYHFICSIHKFPTIYGTRMEADLVVLDNGAPSKPRPAIDIELPSQSLDQVLQQGLAVTVKSDQGAEEVKMIARVGKKIAAVKTGLTVAAGSSRSFRMRFRRGIRGALAERGSANVALVGAARFGEPETLRRRFSER